MALNTENRRRFVLGVLPVADTVIVVEDRAGILELLYFAIRTSGELIPTLFVTESKYFRYAKPRRSTVRRR